MGIEHMNVDHRQKFTRKTRGRIMHLTMHAPNVKNLDIKERIVGLGYIQELCNFFEFISCLARCAWLQPLALTWP